MSFMILDERKDGTGDSFSAFAATRDEAIREADFQWNVLTDREKAARKITVIEGVEGPDEYVEFTFDGDVIYTRE